MKKDRIQQDSLIVREAMEVEELDLSKFGCDQIWVADDDPNEILHITITQSGEVKCLMRKKK